MMETLETMLTRDGIEFSAEEARVRCMPHTVHLSAMEVSHCQLHLTSVEFIPIQLLKAIGTFKDNKKKHSNGAYQDSVTAPIGREHDDDAINRDDENDEDEDEDPDPEVMLREVLSAVEKVNIGDIVE